MSIIREEPDRLHLTSCYDAVVIAVKGAQVRDDAVSNGAVVFVACGIGAFLSRDDAARLGRFLLSAAKDPNDLPIEDEWLPVRES